MSKRSAYVGWFGRLNLPQINSDEREEVRLEDFNFNNNYISFKLVRYITRNVPIKYTTVNYVKHPVEWKQSTRSAVIFKKAKTINLERFCEVELNNYDIPVEFKLEILDRLDYMPSWRLKEIDIQHKQKEIFNLSNSKLNFIDIKSELANVATKFNNDIRLLESEKSKLKIEKASRISFIFRIIFTLLTFGLSWLGYVGSKKLIINKQKYFDLHTKIIDLNNERDNTLIDLKKEYEKRNLEIQHNNLRIDNNIRNIENEIEQIDGTDYSHTCIDDFIDLRKKLLTVTKFQSKGVYIIWNKTKDKYYVGQSKDVYKRLFTQHFSNADVKNILFAKDWYANDEFYYKLIELDTKDELDLTEKEYIDRYDSFRNGYNNTGGNI